MVNLEFNIIIGKPCSGKSYLSNLLCDYYKQLKYTVLLFDSDYIESNIINKETNKHLKNEEILALVNNYKSISDYEYSYNKKNYELTRKLLYSLIEEIIYDPDSYSKYFHSDKVVIILDDVMPLTSERDNYVKILIKNFINFCFIFLDIDNETCLKRNKERKNKQIPSKKITEIDYNYNNFYKKEYYIKIGKSKDVSNIDKIMEVYETIKINLKNYYQKLKDKLIMLERNKTMNEEVHKYFVADSKIKKNDNSDESKYQNKDKKLNTIQNIKDIELRNFISDIINILLGKKTDIPNNADMHLLLNFIKHRNIETKLLKKILTEKKKDFLKLESTKKVSNVNDLKAKFALYMVNM